MNLKPISKSALVIACAVISVAASALWKLCGLYARDKLERVARGLKEVASLRFPQE